MILILNQESAWLYPSILMDSLKMDYPFKIAFVQPPPPHRKNRRRGVCGGGGDCTQASLRRTIHFVALVCNRPTTKCLCPVFLMITKECTERLSALSVSLIIPRGKCVSGPLVRAIFFSQIRHRNALTEIAWEDGDVQGLGMAMSTVTSEKNRELLFTGNVFYKQWHLCLFREHDLLKISNINPGQEARFSLWKKLVHRESGRNGA